MIKPISRKTFTLYPSSQITSKDDLFFSGLEGFGLTLPIHTPLDGELTGTIRAKDRSDTARKFQGGMPLVAHFWLSLVVYLMSKQQTLPNLG
jgi:hypothetical protein